MATYLATAAVTFDLGVLAAAHDWPLEVTTPAVVVLLWLAWMLSLCAFFALRARGSDDDWRERGADDPEPPWWPEFELRLRDYRRDRPRVPLGRAPRAPAGRV
ncbi:MAG: hypothetical protein ACRDKX_09230 [Solirubrobacterales bacterium]